MTDVDRLLEEYIAEHRGGGPADPVEYVQRLEGADRKELAALIDGYLVRAPRAEWDRPAYEQSAAPQLVESLTRSLQGSAGLWPSLLPRLRARARVKRSDLTAELASRLGATGQQQKKVEVYYHEMEQGTLPAGGVSDRVLEALGEILGQSADALRTAGASFTGSSGAPAAEAGVAFTRTAPASGAPDDEAGSPPSSRPSADSGEWDEVDRLFRGG